jgi:hypothetical protein
MFADGLRGHFTLSAFSPDGFPRNAKGGPFVVIPIMCVYTLFKFMAHRRSHRALGQDWVVLPQNMDLVPISLACSRNMGLQRRPFMNKGSTCALEI